MNLSRRIPTRQVFPSPLLRGWKGERLRSLSPGAESLPDKGNE